MLFRCWKRVDGTLHPRAVSQSDSYFTDNATHEAANLAALWGVPGVLQGEGVVYEAAEQVYTVSE